MVGLNNKLQHIKIIVKRAKLKDKLAEINEELPNIADLEYGDWTGFGVIYNFSSLNDSKDSEKRQLPTGFIKNPNFEGWKSGTKVKLPEKAKYIIFDAEGKETSFQTENFHYIINTRD